MATLKSTVILGNLTVTDFIQHNSNKKIAQILKSTNSDGSSPTSASSFNINAVFFNGDEDNFVGWDFRIS